MEEVKKNIIIGVVLVVAIVIGIVVIRTNNTAPTGATVKIGFVGPLTGDAVSYGDPIRNAVEMAVSAVNEEGGTGGKMIEVVYEDGKCANKEALSAVQKLVNIDRVIAIIGGVCSSESLAMLPVTEPAKVVVLSPSSSSPHLSGAGEYFFRNAPSDLKGGDKLAKLMTGQYKNVAIISEETDYAQGLAGVFRERVASLNGTLAASERFAPGTTDFRSILTKIKAKNPDALLVNPQTEIAGGSIVKQAREIGITAQLYGSNVLSGSQAIEIAGEHAEGLIFVDAPGLMQDNPKAMKFLEEYKERHGAGPGIEFYTAAAYDNVRILAQAVEAVGTDTEKIRQYLANMSRFNGIVGSYRFDRNGDPEGIEFIAKKIQNGKSVDVVGDK